MSTTFILVLVVIGAYLAAHVAFDWLARRYRIVSGAEYLLLGILLGPEVSGLMHADVVGGFAPVMTLALGWIGAVVGAQFYVPALVRIPGVFFRIALVEALVSFFLVAALMAGVLFFWVGVSWPAVAVPSVALGAVATTSAPAGIALLSRGLGRGSPVLRQLEVATAVEAAVAVLALGLLLSIVHDVPAVTPRPPTATEWAVISIGIGLVGGLLFHLFLGGEQDIDRLFIALGGSVILASGAAAYLRLSPLLPAMLVGLILVNTSSNREQIKEVLGRVERPLYFVLLIFAGAAWQPSASAWLLPVTAFLLARVAAKLTGAWVGAWTGEGLQVLGHGWGGALMGQGGLALAIGLSYRLHEPALYPNIVFTAAIMSVLLTDLTSARMAEWALRPLLREAPEEPEGAARPASARRSAGGRPRPGEE